MKKAKNYIASLPSDFTAAVVVFLVALPLCLGIALGSGAPLFAGIIGGIVGGVVIGFLSGSHLSVSGPAAGLTAIVVLAIGKLGSFEAFLSAVIICGVLQIILGFLKAGVLGDYIPSSVIKGMLAAIGLILILKQIPHFVGFEGDFQGDETFEQKDGKNTFSELFYSLQHILPAAIGIGLFSLGIQVLWDKVLIKKSRMFKLIPSPLVVVLAGIGINAFLLVMILALSFLTTANFWAYGIKKEKQTSSASVPGPAEEESGSNNGVPNPVEEKSSNGLQNLSEYLHYGHHILEHPVAIHYYGNRHDIINYPVHHCDLIIPPPKQIA